MGKKVAAVSFGFVITALSLAQFIMTVDTTIMNVSIPTLVDDLDTTVSAVQAAITLYALVMASFMLIGGKLGELYGRRKIMQIGLVIYATGSLITAFAPTIGILIFGWSILEGIGASLMMPAMLALITSNFKGKQRLTALGITAAVAGAAAAVGPIIGGALSTYASWRYAFIAEVVIAMITLFMSRKIPDTGAISKEKLDIKGAVMSASGLGIFVFGIMQASTYGWIRSTQPFTIGDTTFELFGFSIVPFICGFGLFMVWRFLVHCRNNIAIGKPALLKVSLLDNKILRPGLSIVLVTQLVLGGTLFIIPLFTQLVLGFTAMESGLAMLPLSIALIAFSIMAPKISAKHTAIKTIRAAQLALVVGLVLMITQVSNDTSMTSLIIPFSFLGAGIGLIFPLNQALILGSVGKSDNSQAAGLNYTAQQLGMSLGTAIIGTVLLFSLGNGISSSLSSSPTFQSAVESSESVSVSSSVEFVSNEQLSTAIDESGEFNEEEKAALIDINSEARLKALKASLAVAAVFALLALQSSGRMKDALENSYT